MRISIRTIISGAITFNLADLVKEKDGRYYSDYGSRGYLSFDEALSAEHRHLFGHPSDYPTGMKASECRIDPETSLAVADMSHLTMRESNFVSSGEIDDVEYYTSLRTMKPEDFFRRKIRNSRIDLNRPHSRFGQLLSQIIFPLDYYKPISEATPLPLSQAQPCSARYKKKLEGINDYIARFNSRVADTNQKVSLINELLAKENLKIEAWNLGWQGGSDYRRWTPKSEVERLRREMTVQEKMTARLFPSNRHATSADPTHTNPAEGYLSVALLFMVMFMICALYFIAAASAGGVVISTVLALVTGWGMIHITRSLPLA